MVTDGVTGLLVPPGSPDNLGRALQSLLERPALAQTLGAAGVQAARERSWEATADGIVAAISRCASQVEPVVP
jgi:glycosyltransferase involved in cell wall biosynthesis